MNNPTFTTFLHENSINADKVFLFVFVFARYEYALKRTGFVKENNNYPSADWSRLAKKLDDSFWQQLTPDLEIAVRYIQDHPPKKQVLSNGLLGWEDTTQNDRKNHLDWLLLMVRRVRNNLFHGGKFQFPKFDESRDGQLLDSSLTILQACLSLDQKVASAFFDPIE